MASNEGVSVRNKPEAVELTESDILGAKLISPINSYIMAELKWWLLCCGIKVLNSWNKKQLISKVYYCTV